MLHTKSISGGPSRAVNSGARDDLRAGYMDIMYNYNNDTLLNKYTEFVLCNTIHQEQCSHNKLFCKQK